MPGDVLEADERQPKPRVRASKTALTKALESITDAGLPVKNVFVIGGKYKIEIGRVDDDGEPENHGGLEEW